MLNNCFLTGFSCSKCTLVKKTINSFLTVFITIAVCFSVTPVHADDKPQPALPTVKLEIGNTQLTAEIAATSQQRYMGLSFRPALDQNAGMLFVYPKEQPLTFTMRNTLIPLSIAFISKDLVINEIHRMDVGPGQLFPSQRPAQYALEVEQGWFEANNIKPGDQIVRSQ